MSLAASYVTPSNVAHDAFVYDRIVTSKTDANLTIPRARSKYKLREPEGLLGAEIEWILRWHQVRSIHWSPYDPVRVVNAIP